MKAKDIKPGEVYAYREHASSGLRPIVFLAPLDRDHRYVKSRTAGRAFLKAEAGTALRAGTVYNSGTVGYPAALGWPHSDLDDLRAVTLDRFAKVTSTLGRRAEYILVTSPARVIGLWAVESPKEN